MGHVLLGLGLRKQRVELDRRLPHLEVVLGVVTPGRVILAAAAAAVAPVALHREVVVLRRRECDSRQVVVAGDAHREFLDRGGAKRQ